MPKFTVTSSSGPASDAASLSFKIEGLENKAGVRLRFENATHRRAVGVDGQPYVDLPTGVLSYTGYLNVDIPEDSSQTVISLYASVEVKGNEGYYRIGLYSAAYTIASGARVTDFSVQVAPSFVGPKDRAEIRVQGDGAAVYVISINDKRFKVRTGEGGEGTFSFYTEDVLDRAESSVLQRFAIYGFSAESNFSESKFTGAFLHVLPSKIATFATCTGPDPSDECFSVSAEHIAGRSGGSVVNVPPSPHLSIKDGDERANCNSIELLTSENVCRIDDWSMANLPNGQVSYAYVGQATGDNKAVLNSVFVNVEDGSVASRLLPERRGIVPPDESGSLYIFVEKSVYDIVSPSWTIQLRHEDFKNLSFVITDKIEPDEYINFYRIKLDLGDLDLDLDRYYLCIPYVAKSNSNAATLLPNGLSWPLKLPPVVDANDVSLSVSKAAIAVNGSEVAEDAVANIYVIVEAKAEGNSQLFYYAFEVRSTETGDSNATWSAEGLKSHGWSQLTYAGENRNPVAKCDGQGSLHIFWEGDRNDLTQIYYGCLGPGSRSATNASLVAALDREAEIKAKGSDAWAVEPNLIFTSNDPNPLNIVKRCDYQVEPYGPNNMWMPYEKGSGRVVVYDDSLISVSGNPSTGQAMAFTTVDKDANGEAFEGTFDQISFGIQFLLSEASPQTILSDQDIEGLYEEWRSKYIEDRDENLDGQVYYRYKDNKFLISGWDREYDRFYPIVGSYKNADLARKFENCEELVEDRFAAHVSGDLRNVNHFIIGIMPEKVRFKSRNSQSFQDFCDDRGLSIDECVDAYVLEEDTVIMTGRYQLFVVMSGDNRYYGSPNLNSYGITRAVGRPFSLDEAKKFKIVPHYVRLFKEDVDAWYDNVLQTQSHGGRFLFSLSVLMNDEPVFGDSILVDMDDKYRAFDIGFGFPGGGQWHSSEHRPYESAVYDNLDVDLTFEDVLIGDAGIEYEDSLISIPTIARSADILVDGEGVEDEVNSQAFIDRHDYLSMGLDEASFPQVPLTLEGHNKSPSISEGALGSAVAVVWQSNQSKYWDICYGDNIERTLPFRRTVRITNSESNSLMPSAAISPNGDRLVVWQDNTDGNYQVYAARSGISANNESIASAFDCDSLAARVVLANPNVPSDPKDPNGPKGPFDSCTIAWQLCVEPCSPFEGYVKAVRIDCGNGVLGGEDIYVPLSAIDY